MICLNEKGLQEAKKALEKGNLNIQKALDQLLEDASSALQYPIDPVTNKSLVPSSGDVHDYFSIRPYFWPNPESLDGTPWIRRDGEINPLARGNATDFVRLDTLFKTLEILWMAYYFTRDVRYAYRAIEQLDAWFVDENTKVNPNANYAQSVPELYEGGCFGIIEWGGLAQVITTVQILQQDQLLPADFKRKIDMWLADFLEWLCTSELGILEQIRLNNHGTNCDLLLMRLMLYLGKREAAVKVAEGMKIRRIASQIEADGKQPLELARTKSVSYSTMNLRAMSEAADLANRHLQIDLWNFEARNHGSIHHGLEFMSQFVSTPEKWEWKQITPGGAKVALETITKPFLWQVGAMFGEEILAEKEYTPSDYKDVLLYKCL